jgi:hypothetical protein
MSARITSLDTSRRRVVSGAGCAALAVFGTAVFGSAADADAKQSQKAARYQQTPHGSQRCDKCKDWAPPASCNSVNGKIVPAGWCLLYAQKA